MRQAQGSLTSLRSRSPRPKRRERVQRLCSDHERRRTGRVDLSPTSRPLRPTHPAAAHPSPLSQTGLHPHPHHAQYTLRHVWEGSERVTAYLHLHPPHVEACVRAQHPGPSGHRSCRCRHHRPEGSSFAVFPMARIWRGTKTSEWVGHRPTRMAGGRRAGCPGPRSPSMVIFAGREVRQEQRRGQEVGVSC